MIALITPTGGRPDQIGLCAEFMKKQDYKGSVLWVIVDDGDPVTIEDIPFDFKENWTIKKLYPIAVWRQGQNTQARNLLVAAKAIQQRDDVEAVFIIEDDDYYSPKYLSTMMQYLQGKDAVGELATVYYNPYRRAWMRNGNTHHASLCQTGFAITMMPLFIKACTTQHVFIDMTFWRFLRSYKLALFNNGDIAIGIKGIPGRGGIGMGHRMDLEMTPDPEMEYLKKLIGEDYLYYKQLADE
jgi:glycosyltransferase involved in cell wall biosynthesis